MGKIRLKSFKRVMVMPYIDDSKPPTGNFEPSSSRNLNFTSKNVIIWIYINIYVNIRTYFLFSNIIYGTTYSLLTSINECSVIFLVN